jgi:hypothetical protein
MGEYTPGLILIVTGSTLRAEQMDRPLAYYIQAQVQELSRGEEGYQALVVSDRFYLSHPDLHELPLISVGGPGVNRLAQKLLKKLPAALAVEDRFYIQMDPEREEMRASIWGLDNLQTKMAVVTFAERYLPRFTQLCWHRGTC